MKIFSIQRKYNFGIFNDEVSKLSNSISKIKLESNYFLPERIVGFMKTTLKMIEIILILYLKKQSLSLK